MTQFFSLGVKVIKPVKSVTIRVVVPDTEIRPGVFLGSNGKMYTAFKYATGPDFISADKLVGAGDLKGSSIVSGRISCRVEEFKTLSPSPKALNEFIKDKNWEPLDPATTGIGFEPDKSKYDKVIARDGHVPYSLLGQIWGLKSNRDYEYIALRRKVGQIPKAKSDEVTGFIKFIGLNPSEKATEEFLKGGWTPWDPNHSEKTTPEETGLPKVTKSLLRYGEVVGPAGSYNNYPAHDSQVIAIRHD